jgi:hypothetical protein
MSLLQQDSPELDDAARGEDLTKGSSHLLATAIFATVVVSLAIAGYFIAGIKPIAITGEIEQVWVHPQHTQTSGFDANGAPMAKESYDQVYVFAKVKLQNHTDKPLFLHQVMTNATMADGIHTSYAATASDYERIYIAYPTMPIPHQVALSPQATIAPGQTVEGIVVSAFRLKKAEWDAHKDLSFTFGIQYQPSLVLTPHSPIVEE